MVKCCLNNVPVVKQKQFSWYESLKFEQTFCLKFYQVIYRKLINIYDERLVLKDDELKKYFT